MEVDEVLTRETGAAKILRGRVIPAPGGLVSKFTTPNHADCPSCNQSATRKVCPHCHSDLPVGTGKIDDRIIAIIGGRGAGKSHYITTLYKRFENEVGRNFDLSFVPHGEDSIVRFQERYVAPLYDRHEVIPATQSVAVDRNTKAPLRFRLTTHDGGSKNKGFYLTFFDTAGEDLTSFETMSAELRYILAAHAIIFILDPCQIPAVRDQLRHTSVPLPPIDSSASPLYIVQRISDLFEEQSLVRRGAKIDIPVAFTLSKIDALFPLIAPESLLRRPGEHWGKLNLAEIDSVHTEIASYLGTWSGNFSNQVDLTFKNFRFFGVSSLGHSPDASGRVQVPVPMRVEEPLLWLLNRFGIIRSV